MAGKLLSTLLSFAMVFSFLSVSGGIFAGDDTGSAKGVSFEESVKRFAGGIRIPTVSKLPYESIDFAQFDRFRAYLKDSYPRIFEAMEGSLIGGHSIVLHWKGKDSSKQPLLFLSHYDVVPVSGYDMDDLREEPIVFRIDDKPVSPSSGVSSSWEYPPFSGAVANGRVYGRGTLDMKGMLFSILEGADALLAEGFVPEQDIWFAFGHDEEISGIRGARQIAPHFREQGLRFRAVFDEGGFILAPGNIMKSIERPVALVGMGEKGFLTLRIKVKGVGGHSSIPPVHPEKSSLVLASEVVKKIDDNPMPAKLIPVIANLIDEMSGGKTNLSAPGGTESLEARQVIRQLEKVSISNALVRTTTAITMMHGSDGANVMSSVAEVTANFRILPGDTVEDVKRHIADVCSGYDVDIEVYGDSREPSSLTSPSSPVMQAIRDAIHMDYPDAIVAPYLTVGATDAYKYQIVSDDIFRIIPALIDKSEIRTVHNENEYLSLENYGRMIKYFRALMEM